MIDDEKYCPDCGGISKIVEVEGKEKTIGVVADLDETDDEKYWEISEMEKEKKTKSITKYLRNILKRKNV